MKTHNPRGLTDRQAEVMDALVKCGCSKQVAADLGIQYRVVDYLARAAARKLSARNRAMALLAWDRLRRSPVAFHGPAPANSVFHLATNQPPRSKA